MDKRWHKVQWGSGQQRARTSAANWRQPLLWNRTPFFECLVCHWRGERKDIAAADLVGCPICHDFALPARRRVFCASLADVFDNEVPRAWRLDLFELIEATPHLDWLLLTKRIGNAFTMLPMDFCPARYPNVWLGSTVVNREEMLRDGPKLAVINAAVTFWSVEPMLGDLGEIPEAIMPSWVIAGGESGPKARPSDVEWFRGLMQQCKAAGVAFHLKQITERGRPTPIETWPEDLRVQQFPSP